MVGTKMSLLLLLGALLLLGCTQSSTQNATPSLGAAASTPATASNTLEATTAPVPAVQVFKITAMKWQFDPATITVKKGVPVRFELTSKDVTHGFSIMQFGVKASIKPGETTVVEFTPDKAGTFTFFCSVFCGEGHRGQKGQLIVTE